MENKKVPYLCGGTLFFLLVQTKKPRSNARERENGVKDHLTDPEMMEGLIQAITGNYTHANGGSLKKDTSQFRECKINGSTSIPINEQAVISSYDYDIKNNYSIALSRMVKFSEDFLDPSKAAWLVRVLLDMIGQDDIDESTPFFVLRNGSLFSKSDLNGIDRLDFQPFLTGVVHYILTHRTDNISGLPTLDVLGIKKEGQERKAKKDFPFGNSLKVYVDWYTSAEAVTLADEQETGEEQEIEPEYAETEIIDNCSEKVETKTANQSVFINSGNGIQIGVNYGTINLSPQRNTKDS